MSLIPAFLFLFVFVGSSTFADGFVERIPREVTSVRTKKSFRLSRKDWLGLNLILSVKEEDYRSVLALLRTGADINYQYPITYLNPELDEWPPIPTSSMQWRPLYQAQSLEMVNLLMKNGVHYLPSQLRKTDKLTKRLELPGMDHPVSVFLQRAVNYESQADAHNFCSLDRELIDSTVQCAEKTYLPKLQRMHEIIRYFVVRKGLSANGAAAIGWHGTNLHYVLNSGAPKTLELLLQLNVELSPRNQLGQLPQDSATHKYRQLRSTEENAGRCDRALAINYGRWTSRIQRALNLLPQAN